MKWQTEGKSFEGEADAQAEGLSDIGSDIYESRRKNQYYPKLPLKKPRSMSEEEEMSMDKRSVISEQLSEMGMSTLHHPLEITVHTLYNYTSMDGVFYPPVR
jgi:hypothetical protein